MDLRVVGGEALWRIRYRAKSELTVEHHAQRTLMPMLGAVGRYAGSRKDQVAIHVAEPYAAEARLLQDRLDVAVRPRRAIMKSLFPQPGSAIGRRSQACRLIRRSTPGALSIDPLPRHDGRGGRWRSNFTRICRQQGIDSAAGHRPARHALQRALAAEHVSYRDLSAPCPHRTGGSGLLGDTDRHWPKSRCAPAIRTRPISTVPL